MTTLWSVREDLHRDFDAQVGPAAVDRALDEAIAEHAGASTVTRFLTIFIEKDARAALAAPYFVAEEAKVA